MDHARLGRQQARAKAGPRTVARAHGRLRTPRPPAARRGREAEEGRGGAGTGLPGTDVAQRYRAAGEAPSKAQEA